MDPQMQSPCSPRSSGCSLAAVSVLIILAALAGPVVAAATNRHRPPRLPPQVPVGHHQLGRGECPQRAGNGLSAARPGEEGGAVPHHRQECGQFMVAG